MISDIAMYVILGRPLVMYGGILSIILLISTATVGYLNFRGKTAIPFKWHPRLAIATITVALLHAILGLSISLNF